jgi:hypothetical protein
VCDSRLGGVQIQSLPQSANNLILLAVVNDCNINAIIELQLVRLINAIIELQLVRLINVAKATYISVYRCNEQTSMQR